MCISDRCPLKTGLGPSLRVPGHLIFVKLLHSVCLSGENCCQIKYRTSMHAKLLQMCLLFMTQWTVACQAPLSMGFSRQEYWSGLPYPLPGDLPNWEIKPRSLRSPALTGRFFTTSITWETQNIEHLDIFVFQIYDKYFLSFHGLPFYSVHSVLLCTKVVLLLVCFSKVHFIYFFCCFLCLWYHIQEVIAKSSFMKH